MPDEAADSQAPTLIYVSPDVLLFDPDNPRFAGAFTGKTQDQIQQAIFGEPHFASELVDSFLANGFIDYEPLVVKADCACWQKPSHPASRRHTASATAKGPLRGTDELALAFVTIRSYTPRRRRKR